ncbi:glutamine synthetase [candidate division WOR-3 bacterium]|nr:glutamine synthetase [candidate division WOR-3 bacterium]
MNKSDLFSLLKAGEVKAIRLWFTDILGKVKGFSISHKEAGRALNEGMNFDGSSIEGLVRIEESDLTAKPDLSSSYIFPDENGKKTIVFVCDIYYPDGTPVESSPRHVLKSILKQTKKNGWDFFVGSELEFFYFSEKRNLNIRDTKGYFDVLPYDKYDEISEEIVNILNGVGVEVEVAHHEVSENQHEIDLRYEEALKMADHIQVAKYVIKETARANGVFATFMPKPVFGLNGSGLHLHQSFFSKGKNIFYDKKDNYHLSPIAKNYSAGLLRYAIEITSITNQWVNSYKRLVPGYEAPVYVSWGRQNRSALLRVPSFKSVSSCRVEYRTPDPATNPYLAISAMLGAGLAGIKEKLELGNPIEEDIYTMSKERKKKLNIEVLPDSLYTAIMETEKSKMVKGLFGDRFFNKYIQNKKKEWENYRIHVTDYEIDKYLSL